MENYNPYNRWLHQHDEYIKAEFPDRPTAELADECDANYYTVSRRATRLGVSKSEAFMHTSWKKGGGGGRFLLNDEIKQYMQAHFADTTNAELATLFGVDVKTVRRWAGMLGLVKSDGFMFFARSRGKKGKKFYTEEQIAWRNRRIAEVYPDADDEELNRLADELCVTRSTIAHMAHEIGVKRSVEQRRKAYDRMGKVKTKYGPDVIEAIRAYYPNHTNEECSARFDISNGVITQLAIKHGMRKTKEHVSRVLSEARRKQKR